MNDRSAFSNQLKSSMQQWETDGIRGVWIKLSEKNAHLIDIVIRDGKFKYHHAKDGYVMMTKWMDKESIDKMPSFATHYVGVGGLVLSKDRKKILAI
jgi:hypothetical protein